MYTEIVVFDIKEDLTSKTWQLMTNGDKNGIVFSLCSMLLIRNMVLRQKQTYIHTRTDHTERTPGISIQAKLLSSWFENSLLVKRLNHRAETDVQHQKLIQENHSHCLISVTDGYSLFLLQSVIF
jgi:hypothetical protein